ncbi:hypothetical protein ABRY23_08260 [Melioribacteraceae bacterium 4301-Me]|uniref:hypothetical protein n=1 Tax=Pyranulibacter aquaticus TaxID=3163344 RepID=UPI0035989FDB
MKRNDYKDKVDNILKIIEELSSNKINNKEDLSRIIEIAVVNSKMDLLEELSFSAKFISGLLKVAKSRNDKIEESYLKTIEREYLENISKVKVLLEEMLSYSSDFIREIFSNKFLMLSHESLNNLNQLCNDLAWVKIYFNEMKRGGLA